MKESEYIKEIALLNKKIDLLLKNVIISKECKYSFFEWLDEWFDTYKKPVIKEKSLYSIKVCIDKHIKKNLDDVNLAKLTAIDVQKALNKVSTSRMRKYTYDVYNASLRVALQMEYIEKDIMLNVSKVKHKRKNGRALSIAEQVKFIKDIKGNKFEKLYKFYLLSGCRKSEAISICWNDVDYENKTLKINGTKTDASERVIPLFPDLKKLFDSINKKGELVFDNSVEAITCNFKRLKKMHNYNFTLHSLRHTFATRCLENGISMKVVQRWMGHSKLDTTANIYMHVQSDFEKNEIKKYNIKI